MKKTILISTTIALLLVASFIISCNSGSSATTTSIDDSTANFKYTPEQAEHGKYLVMAMGCHDCHSPKVFGPNGMDLDTTRLLSGHPAGMPIGNRDTAALKEWVMFGPMMTAIAGPWGVSFTANISSDETGVGNWSLRQFKKALQEGKYKGLDASRTLLPPMPWPMYKNLKEEDVRDIFAYLKSTKPIKNIVPSPLPPAGVKQ